MSLDRTYHALADPSRRAMLAHGVHDGQDWDETLFNVFRIDPEA